MLFGWEIRSQKNWDKIQCPKWYFQSALRWQWWAMQLWWELKRGFLECIENEGKIGNLPKHKNFSR